MILSKLGKIFDRVDPLELAMSIFLTIMITTTFGTIIGGSIIDVGLTFLGIMVILGILLVAMALSSIKFSEDSNSLQLFFAQLLIWIILGSIVTLFVFFPQITSIGLFIIIALIIVEALFWADRSVKPKGWNVWSYTIVKKLEAIGETIILFSVVNSIRVIFEKLRLEWQTIIKWAMQIGLWLVIGLVVAAIIFSYIYLNSLKYRGKEEVKKKCRRK